MQIFLHKFAICRIFNGLSKGFTLKTFTRVRDLEGRTAWSGRTNVAENRQTVGKYKRKNRQCLYELTACRTYSVCYILMCLRYI